MLDHLRADLVAAARSLRRSPGTAVAAVATLAVAAGLNLAMFGLIDRALLMPPALVSSPSQVFTVGFELDDAGGLSRGHMTTAPYPIFTALHEHASLLQSAAAFQRLATSAIADERQIPATAMLVSGSYSTCSAPLPSSADGSTRRTMPALEESRQRY